jgi:large subunit ribosomal protein L21
MFAVIKTGGKQYRAQEGDVLHIERLNKKKGQKVSFNEVLLIEDDGKAVIGTPLVKDAVVKAVVLDNIKDKKVVVFKKKRRKRYKKKIGHRQLMTKVKIEEILYGKTGAKKKPVKPKSKAKPKPKSGKKTGAGKTRKKSAQKKSTQKRKPPVQKAKQTKKGSVSQKKTKSKGSGKTSSKNIKNKKKAKPSAASKKKASSAKKE